MFCRQSFNNLMCWQFFTFSISTAFDWLHLMAIDRVGYFIFFSLVCSRLLFFFKQTFRARKNGGQKVERRQCVRAFKLIGHVLLNVCFKDVKTLIKNMHIKMPTKKVRSRQFVIETNFDSCMK